MPMPPKVDPQRGYRGKSGPTKLPAEGRPGEPPAWPLAGRTSAAERDRWAELWATPQAVAWERLGQGCAHEVARYCRLAVRCDKASAAASLHAQATALADRLGLTPKAMRLLLWEIVADEVGEARTSGTSARDRMKAL